jgi:phosphate uptake regulator
VISRIERIADHAALIAKRIKFLSVPIEPKLLMEIESLSKDAIICFESAIESLIKKDHILAEKVALKITQVVEKENETLSILKETKNSTIIKFILEDIRRTAEYSSDLIEIVVNETIRDIITEK